MTAVREHFQVVVAAFLEEGTAGEEDAGSMTWLDWGGCGGPAREPGTATAIYTAALDASRTCRRRRGP
jgi:hypothetical protein